MADIQREKLTAARAAPSSRRATAPARPNGLLVVFLHIGDFVAFLALGRQELFRVTGDLRELLLALGLMASKLDLLGIANGC